jgi:hypothetical protein
MDEIQYKLEHVKVTPIAADNIDKTFRSSCIGLLARGSPQRRCARA